MSLALAAAGAVIAAPLVGAGLLARARVRAIKDAHPPSGRFTEIDGRRVHVLESGEGRPVVLVHGAAARGADILPFMRAALGGGVRLIAPDRAGAGWSEPFRGRPRLERHASDLAAFIAQEKLDRPLAVAHSYGCAVALRLALDHPDALSGLVCLGPASHGDVGPVKAYNHLAVAPLIGPVLTHLIAPLIGPRFVPAGLRSSFHPQEPPADYAATTQQALLFRPACFRANCEDLAAVNLELLAQQTRYSEISVPVAVIAGEDDQVVFTSRHAERLAAAIPDSRLALLPGVGHVPHHARPGLVAEHVLALMEAA